MPLAAANQSQLIRSSQKDEYYRTFLRNNSNEAFQTLAGSKRWLDWRREMELLSDLAYYGLTTFSGYQTLGEEYVNIVQVDPTERRVPSRARRGLFVLCHAYFPYLVDKVLVCLENELECGQDRRGGGRQRRAAPELWWSLESWLRRWIQRVVGLLSVPQRRACMAATFVLRPSLSLLHRFHAAVFYLSGSFYHLSKRAAGIRYVRLICVWWRSAGTMEPSGAATGCWGRCPSSSCLSQCVCSSTASDRSSEPGTSGSSTGASVLSAHTPQAPRLPAASSAWRRGDTPPALPVDTSSAGSASRSGATPRVPPVSGEVPASQAGVPEELQLGPLRMPQKHLHAL
ncbi:peroxisome biogenesis factor 10 isoform X2 [Pungitius pungitius]|uniref:peroxisome biogenesis factor 10 isoform X2 n=1 Tax=Pungitius pungitius TaxID=134920 RepID=UPI002E14FB0A